jgi:beta-D-xylosidase 4
VSMGGDHAATISGGTPSCANARYLRGILRKQWGWEDGFIVSDCQAIAIIKAGHGYRTAEDPHAVPKSQIHGDTDQSDYVDAARKAIRASTDFNCGQAYQGYLEDTIRDGSNNETLVDESLTRMYKLMHRLGIFNTDTAKPAYATLGPKDVDNSRHRAIARSAAAQSVTLLKNSPIDGHRLLPMDVTQSQKIAVIGPLANATMGMLSNYHPNSPSSLPPLHSPLAALRARAHHVEYHQGAEVECETPRYCVAADRANISSAAAAAADADVVLLFLGMNSNGNNGTGTLHGGDGSSESEAKDRYDINLRGVQSELLEAVVAANGRVVLVLMNAGCLAFNHSLVPSILEVY